MLVAATEAQNDYTAQTSVDSLKANEHDQKDGERTVMHDTSIPRQWRWGCLRVRCRCAIQLPRFPVYRRFRSNCL